MDGENNGGECLSAWPEEIEKEEGHSFHPFLLVNIFFFWKGKKDKWNAEDFEMKSIDCFFPFFANYWMAISGSPSVVWNVSTAVCRLPSDFLSINKNRGISMPRVSTLLTWMIPRLFHWTHTHKNGADKQQNRCKDGAFLRARCQIQLVSVLFVFWRENGTQFVKCFRYSKMALRHNFQSDK